MSEGNPSAGQNPPAAAALIDAGDPSGWNSTSTLPGCIIAAFAGLANVL